MRNSRPEYAIAAARASALRVSTHVDVANPPNTAGSVADPVMPHAVARAMATTKSGTGSNSHPIAAPRSRTTTCQPLTSSPDGGAIAHRAIGTASASSAPASRRRDPPLRRRDRSIVSGRASTS